MIDGSATEGESPTRVYVRYVGTRACITNRSGGFVMIDREELNDSERALCEAGGGHFVMSDMVYTLLQWK